MAESDVYSFDEKLQVQILSLLRSGDLSDNDVKPLYFDNPILASVCKSLHSLNGNRHHVTPEILTHEVSKDLGSSSKELTDDIKKYVKFTCRSLPESHVSYIKNLASEFAEFTLYKRTILDSLSLLRQGDIGCLEVLRNKWNTVVNTQFLQDEDLGKFYFSTVGERLKKRFERPDILKSLIPELDSSLDEGGFSRGELCVFCATTGMGKSMSLAHIAKVSIFQKKKVLYYSHEMSFEKLAARLDASLSNVLTWELRNQSALVAEKVSKIGQQYGDILVIKNYPMRRARVSDYQRHMEQLRRQHNFVPDVIIVDYINVVAPEVRTGASYHDIGSIYGDLIGLCQELHMWGFTAAQGNRGSRHAELLDVDGLADSYMGSMDSHVVITLNQTPDEYRKKMMRLFIAKDRSGLGKVIIPIHVEFERGNFFRRVK